MVWLVQLESGPGPFIERELVKNFSHLSMRFQESCLKVGVDMWMEL